MRGIKLKLLDPPKGPRRRHDPSLMDMNQPRPEIPDVGPEARDPPQRINPCSLCNVGFFGGALTLGIMLTGIHFLAMCYCVMVYLFTKEYTMGFLKFWGINLHWEEDSEDNNNLLDEVKNIALAGGILEGIACIAGILLFASVIKENRGCCYFWCLISSLITSIQVFLTAFLATRLSFLVLVPVPFAILLHVYGLWVIIAYVKVLGDPIQCPICRHLFNKSDYTRQVESSRSLP